MERKAKYNIGDVVLHKRQGYRALVIDIDTNFQSSGYSPRNSEKEFALKNPWYRLLVDSTSHMTYVEECLLIRDLSGKEIDNPNIDLYLTGKHGKYNTINKHH